MKRNLILTGDARLELKKFDDNYADCCITSPPYFQLRDYDIKGQLGLETTIYEYIRNQMQVFKEVQRILKPTGVFFLNLGDTYAAYWGDNYGKAQSFNGDRENKGNAPPSKPSPKFSKSKRIDRGSGRYDGGNAAPGENDNIKPKDLFGVPWSVALALRGSSVISHSVLSDWSAMLQQAIDEKNLAYISTLKNTIDLWNFTEMFKTEGWYLRQDIIWQKDNPLPESVKDRCTKSHEYLFMFTKTNRYYFDTYAIMEEANFDGRKTTMMKPATKYNGAFVPGQVENTFHASGHERWLRGPNGEYLRNKRSVWVINNKPYKDAHFAVFPEELPRICIKAASSEKGCCADCGKPWKRILVKDGQVQNKKAISKKSTETVKRYRGDKSTENSVFAEGMMNVYKSVGWEPTCECHGKFVKKKLTKTDPLYIEGEKNEYTVYEPKIPLDQHPIKPAVILDPFMGSGTVAVVAKGLNRDYIGVELNPKYVKLKDKRIEQSFGMFADL